MKKKIFTKDYYVNEPYEQVKQKIMNAEKYDLNDVVVEHFTKEEYSLLIIGEEEWEELAQLKIENVRLKAEIEVYRNFLLSSNYKLPKETKKAGDK